MVGESFGLPLPGGDPEVTVKRNGTLVGTRGAINLIEGSNVTLTVTDDAANDELDVTIASSASGGGSVAYATQIVADGPVAYYRLGESSGTTVNDEISTNDGTYQNSPTLGTTGLITGDADTAVTLDGTNDWIDIPNLGIGTTWSVEMWINPTSWANDERIFGTADTVIGSLRYNNQRLEWWDGSTWSVIILAPTVGTKHQLVVSHDAAGVVRGYVNGQFNGGRSGVARSVFGERVGFGSPMRVSGSPAGGYFHGVMDEISIWDVLLTEKQVWDHYYAAA